MALAQIEILLEGYFKEISPTRCRAGSTVILIQDEGKNILVDTGNSQDKIKILEALQKYGLKPKDINIVINTHFHADHVGCNYLFEKARFIVPGVAFWQDVFDRDKKNLKLTHSLKLIPTPGHSEDSATLLVKTDRGMVACAGDLFWSEHDQKIKLMEEDCSDKKLFYQNREKILKLADYVIPGHGGQFRARK